MSIHTKKTTFSSIARSTIKTEIQAIENLLDRVNREFENACDTILSTTGHVIVLGMGKSGHIAKKIAATLASTGTPAFFVHPGEAGHGDLGMIKSQDTVIAISNSGETKELISLLPLIIQIGAPIISLSGKKQSTLTRLSTINLDVSVEQEACPLNLAPTASTTATLVMGDALAIALQQSRGFTARDFAKYHPGGSLGNQLLLKVQNIMHTHTDIPKVSPSDTLKEALYEISKKRLGMTTIVDSKNRLLGVFTDGDLRRCLDEAMDVHHIKLEQLFTQVPKTIQPSTLASNALKIMNRENITSLVIVDSENTVLGVVHMHDILKIGIS